MIIVFRQFLTLLNPLEKSNYYYSNVADGKAYVHFHMSFIKFLCIGRMKTVFKVLNPYLKHEKNLFG